jgi:antitoxin ParD1/3/4
MARVTIALPDYLKEFVDAEAAARGLGSAREYLYQLVTSAHLEKHREQIERLLLQGLDSGPATPMTAQDWQEIRQQIGRHLARDKKKRGRRPA